MKLKLLLLGLLTHPIFATESYTPPPGSTLVTKIEWKNEAIPRGAELKQTDERSSISIKKTTDAPTTIRIWRSLEPGIQTRCYALRGSIQYNDVQGTGYLELLNLFLDESSHTRFFSRTLADVGPMKKISGTSPWRTVWIPFDATESKTLPEALYLNLVLPGSGSVELSSLELYQFADAGAMWAALSNDAQKMERSPFSRSPFSINWGLVAIIGITASIGILGVIGLIRHRRKAERRRMRAMDRG